MNAREEQSAHPSALVMDMLFGFQVSHALCAAARLGVADLLKDGGKTVDELAAATDTKAPLLYRLLRALAGVGVFAEQASGEFVLTPLAVPLQRDAPEGSVHGYAVMVGERFMQEPWQELLNAVRTGEVAFERTYGTPLFDWLATHREADAMFNDAMTSHTSREADAVVAAYDFGEFKTIVDVAGGHGSLLARILAANPSARGVLFEQPHVVDGAVALLQQAGLGERSSTVAGSIFESVPAGGDLYILKRILHDWDDELSRVILENCRRAMNVGGRVLVVDQVIPPGNDPHVGKFHDLSMMVMLGAQERTREQFAALLLSAGLRLTRVVTLPTIGLVEAVAA